MPLTNPLPECITAIFDCNSTTPACQNSAGFDFSSLWSITTRYAEQCPHGPWLFGQSDSPGPISTDQIALTNDACRAIAGADWKKYPGVDIWQRLTTWKFPLFQLVANSPRPPLGFWVEAFAFFHFLGDPIGTIEHTLRKVDACETRAIFWQNCLKNELKLLHEEQSELEEQRLWKALAIIVDSFDEWGTEAGDRAEKYLLEELPDTSSVLRKNFLRVCLQTADALAADRSTKFVPVTIAQVFFVSSVAIAMIRTSSPGVTSSPTSFINIEMYSIGFTAQYFWVVFAVLWTSIIGVSQTAAALPRILTRFYKDIENELAGHGVSTHLPIYVLKQDELRIYSGGIYSWQPNRPWKLHGRRSMSELPLSQFSSCTTTNLCQRFARFRMWVWSIIFNSLPIIIVALAAGTGQLISALVPPFGWSCRSTAMLWMFVAWIGSYIVSLVGFIVRKNEEILFWATFFKDFIVTGATFGIIVYTQFGVLNKCDCYTQNGRVGLQLPHMPAVLTSLSARLHGAFPLVMTCGIAIQLVFIPVLLIWQYNSAVRVYLQRDDGTSNLDWWYTFWQYCKVKLCRKKGPTNTLRRTIEQASEDDIEKVSSETVIVKTA